MSIFSPQETIDQVKEDLYLNMKFSLREYSRTLIEYNSIVDEFGADSSIAIVFYSKLNHFREEYHQLRVQYESLYGDVNVYNSNLSRVPQWSRQVGTRLLMRPLYSEAVIG